ncbi:MAG TPA: ABC transporter ATP-binding protein, partial [Acidimicrobiales bacterium]|nr:ABC transporter ATP-binding protein [Acidimicrobiales bacterium]
MNDAAHALFELDSVSASYSSYRALFGVSLSVPERGIVALLGSNGAGKSTLARVATGLVPATSGEIRLGGQDVTHLPAHQIARLGVAHVPEGRGLFASLTVEENLTLVFRRKLGRQGVRAGLDRAFAAFPVLAERRRQMGGTLSGGQQRMLSLARVLATAPRVLIVDELSLGLAPVVVDTVYESLLNIRDAGSALIVVEQQVDRALAIADRAVLLAHGSVAWTGPADQARAAVEDLLSSRIVLGEGDGNGSCPPP